jgi:multidrug efflux pump subunit AcrA (membrane-fusion protein)
MNNANSTTTDGIENARQHIVRLAKEIEALAESNAPPEAFYQGFLQRLTAALGAEGAAVWISEEGRGLEVKSKVQAPGVAALDGGAAAYGPLLQEIMQNGGVRVFRPGADERMARMPTQHVVILGAIQPTAQPVGVLQILQRGDSPGQASPGYLQFVEQMCSHVSRYLRNRQKAPAATMAEGGQWAEFNRFLLEMYGSLNLGEVAAIAANDGCQFLGCDRVSVAERFGRRTLVRAVTGQDSVNQRSNLVRLMTQLVARVLDGREALRYSGKPEGVPPQLEQPLADYLHEGRSRMLTIVPIVSPEPVEDRQPSDDDLQKRKDQERREPLGALIVEQVSDERLGPDFDRRVELLREHLCRAMSNARRHHGIFLLPLWLAIGRQWQKLRGRRLAKTLVVLAALVLLVTALVVVPWDYRVEGKGRLMPIERRNVFAPHEGKVIAIPVHSGQRVERGELLLQLENKELHQKLEAARNELNEKLKLQRGLKAQLAEAVTAATREDAIRLRGKLSQTEIEIEGVTKQIELLKEQEESLAIRSPMSGIVATFQIDQLLSNRPVRRGELLLEVMNDSGDWRLELEVPEKRLGHILTAQERFNTQNLDVEFRLATAPETTFDAKLESSATRSVVSEKEGTVIEMFASLASQQMPNRRIGAEATAKINCGKRSLGYVLFGDVIEFLRKFFWL